MPSGITGVLAGGVVGETHIRLCEIFLDPFVRLGLKFRCEVAGMSTNLAFPNKALFVSPPDAELGGELPVYGRIFPEVVNTQEID